MIAGSERQKSSGAAGERLREASSINKSLSSLGLVIMSLVDVQRGAQRHVPYRDSRLTYLLQVSIPSHTIQPKQDVCFLPLTAICIHKRLDCRHGAVICQQCACTPSHW